MLDHNDKMTMTKMLDNAITASKGWSAAAHTTFTDLAEKARNDVVTKGDLTFIGKFREQFGIAGQTQTLNDRTLETQFVLVMQPVHAHFGRFAAQYERDRKRASYLEMLRSGRKEEFLVILRSHLGVVNDDFNLTQEVWQTFNKEEQMRQQCEQNDLRKVQLEKLKERQLVQRIEAEAKRRIEQEAFEAAVQAKMRELKQ